MFKKRPKYNIGDKVFLVYEASNKIVRKEVTGILKMKGKIYYILDGDNTYYYYESALYPDKTLAKKELLLSVEKDFYRKKKEIQKI